MRVSRKKFRRASEEAMEAAELDWNAKGGNKHHWVDHHVERAVERHWGTMPAETKRALRQKMTEELGFEACTSNAIPDDFDLTGGY